MNISILKLARRFSCGTRMWIVPGFSNAAKISPSCKSFRGWGASFHWPAIDARDNSEIIRSVDLNRHRSIARNAAKDIIKNIR